MVIARGTGWLEARVAAQGACASMCDGPQRMAGPVAVCVRPRPSGDAPRAAAAARRRRAMSREGGRWMDAAEQGSVDAAEQGSMDAAEHGSMDAAGAGAGADGLCFLRL
jgi:hypothetical protein